MIEQLKHQSNASIYHFPMACPVCGTSKGFPYRATTMANGNTCVDLRCADCRSGWELEITGQALAVSRKMDRRGNSLAFL